MRAISYLSGTICIEAVVLGGGISFDEDTHGQTLSFRTNANLSLRSLTAAVRLIRTPRCVLGIGIARYN